MRRHVLVLRPEPGALATANLARALGLNPVLAPLFIVRPVPWTPPSTEPQAVLLTSANAIRHGGPDLRAMTAYPLYAVGSATAEIARQAGFERIIAGDTDAVSIVERAAGDGIRTLFHPCGREHLPIAHPALSVDRRIVYASDPVATLPDTIRESLPDMVALLHSPRAAALFAALVDPRQIRIAAISAATLKAAGFGWRAVTTAAKPSDASLLAAAAKLCDQRV